MFSPSTTTRKQLLDRIRRITNHFQRPIVGRRGGHPITIAAVCLLFLASCYPSLRRSVAEVSSAVPGWALEERCIDQGCVAKADALVSKGLEIEVEPYNERHHFRLPRALIVSVRFVIRESADYIYDPSKSFITTQKERTVFAKGAKNVVFHAGTGKPNSVTGDFLTHPYQLNGLPDSTGARRERITLFFDIDSPAVSESFTLTIAGLTKNRAAILVPTLIYSAQLR